MPLLPQSAQSVPNHGYLSTISTSPSLTGCVSLHRISATFPSSGASTGISIFMLSRITSTSPAFTSSPTFFSIFQTVPVMWAGTSGMSEPLQEMGVDLAPREGVAGEHTQVRRDVRRHALDGELLERAAHARDGLLARLREGDRLGEQRVVVRRHGVAGAVAGIDPDAVVERPVRRHGSVEALHRPRRGEEPDRILRVDPALDRMPARAQVVLAQGQLLAGRDPQLELYQIEPGGRLRHRMLDLQPRVQLDEVHLVADQEELAGPGVRVSHRPRRAQARV